MSEKPESAAGVSSQGSTVRDGIGISPVRPRTGEATDGAVQGTRLSAERNADRRQ